MYKWRVDFHMKNGEIISIAAESTQSGSFDFVKKDLRLESGGINGYMSLDGTSHIFIRTTEVSSFEVMAFDKN